MFFDFNHFRDEPRPIGDGSPFLQDYIDAWDKLRKSGFYPKDSPMPTMRLAYLKPDCLMDEKKTQKIFCESGIRNHEEKYVCIDAEFCRRLPPEKRQSYFMMAMFNYGMHSRELNNYSSKTFMTAYCATMASFVVCQHICNKKNVDSLKFFICIALVGVLCGWFVNNSMHRKNTREEADWTNLKREFIESSSERYTDLLGSVQKYLDIKYRGNLDLGLDL